MKYKKVYVAVISILLCTCALIAVRCHRLYAEEQNLLQIYTNEMIKEIVCIGDSLTAGTGGEGVSYPSYLEELLWDKSIYIPVRNLGVGGENAATITGRMGAIPYKVGAFTIPADTMPVEIKFISEENKKIEPLIQGDAGLNPCEIAGITGRISISQQKENAGYQYFFTRSKAGDKTEVQSGSEVHTYAANAFKNGIFIIFMGENNGYQDIDDLIEQQKAIINLQYKEKGKYLILGLTSGTAKERQKLENRMVETYGDKYINLREYLSTDGPYDAEVKLTSKDKEQMALGKVPDCLLSDGVHFKAIGYQLIAKKVFERMNELRYFDEVLDEVEIYGDREA